MEVFTVFLGLLGVFWAILNIILFFKLWGMTNDVMAIKEYLLSKEKPQDISDETNDDSVSLNVGIKKGDIVINKENGEELIVLQVYPDGDVTCKTNKNFGLRRVVKIDCLEKFEETKEN